MGSILSGCVSAGIYTTNSSNTCRYLTDHCKAKLVVVDTNIQLEKYCEIHRLLPDLTAIVVWKDQPDFVLKACFSVPVYSWNEFLDLGVFVDDIVIAERTADISPGNCCSLIYTSGTTGMPKAVMLSHDNIIWTVKNVLTHFITMEPSDRVISYLPLSHVAASLIDMFAPICSGFSTYFAQPDALKGSLAHTMKEVKPSIFFAVPRVWEKMEEKLKSTFHSASFFNKALLDIATSASLEKSKNSQSGNAKASSLKFKLMNSMVLKKIKSKLGLSKCRACFTAAAPISEDTLWFFASLNIPVYEIFGQSECTGPHTVSNKNHWKVGYCGMPLKGTKSKIDSVSGEICYKGRHVFMGYLNMPDKTMETFDAEGYLKSGDIGYFDTQDSTESPGFLKVTCRLKDLIITSGGENISPILIENEIKEALPVLSNCVVIGDRRNFLVALVSLKVMVDTNTGIPSDTLAKESLDVGLGLGSMSFTMTDAGQDPIWRTLIDEGIAKANSKAISNAHHVRKWLMLPEDLSESGGELTPTLKIKRNVVNEKYKKLIETLYTIDV